jgi:LmbE family N-acetylglucosaminyl deacetylase
MRQALKLRFGLEGTRRPVDDVLGARRVTLVFAHMDDEVNACGLVLRLRAAGADVDLVVLTDGAANPWTDERVVGARTHFECRRDELLRSLQALGVSDVVLPRFPDSKLDAHVDEATRVVAQHLAARRSDLVITFDPAGLNRHRDHCAAHVAAVRAVRTVGSATSLAFLSPPPPFSFVLGCGFRSQAPVELRTLTLTDAERETKARLVEAYASQARTLRLMMLGLPPRAFFRAFPHEWYVWLDPDAARAWLATQR